MRVRMRVDFEFFLLQALSSSMVDVKRDTERERERIGFEGNLR